MLAVFRAELGDAVLPPPVTEGGFMKVGHRLAGGGGEGQVESRAWNG